MYLEEYLSIHKTWGKIKCVVTGPRCYWSDLPNVGLEVLCLVIISIDDAKNVSN